MTSKDTTPRYRGRFAPSPTGPLHFGSLVAAVGSYLDAKARGGEWLVRIEDVDTPRNARGATDAILRALEACGMAWDGPVVFQGTRTDAYRAALRDLEKRRLAYPCACTRREVADSAVAGVEGYVYPGTCRAGLPAGRSACSVRIDTRGAKVGFDDAAQGRIEHDLETDIGDFVLYRADRIFAYQLAVVVDDAEQGITDIVRGADLLDSTPRQIYLQQLLGLPTPRYLHLPVAVNALGEKLSKQTRAPAIDTAAPLMELVTALEFLGQAPPHDLAAGTAGDLWDWAIANWRREKLPRTRTRPAPVL